MIDTQALHNSQRFRALVADSRLAQATAMTLFNRGRAQPVTESGWKSWLAEPASDRWAAISDADLAHAQQVFAALSVRAGAQDEPLPVG